MADGTSRLPWPVSAQVVVGALTCLLLALGYIGATTWQDDVAGWRVAVVDLATNVLGGLVGVLLAFVVIAVVKRNGFVEDLAATVTKKLDVHFDNRLSITSATIGNLEIGRVRELCMGSHTWHMSFLYEEFWGKHFMPDMANFLLSDHKNRIFVFQPDSQNKLLIKALAERHYLDYEDFRLRVNLVRKTWCEEIRRLGSERGVPRLDDRIVFYAVAAPGPSYTGYLFDSQYWEPSATQGTGTGSPQRAIVRLYTSAVMYRTPELPTLEVVEGELLRFMRQDLINVRNDPKRVERLDAWPP